LDFSETEELLRSGLTVCLGRYEKGTDLYRREILTGAGFLVGRKYGIKEARTAVCNLLQVMLLSLIKEAILIGKRYFD
jgi:uncharacterized protein YfiM (DUF2279 family)